MSNFTTALFLTIGGAPITGRPPVRFHVLGEFAPTQDQLSQAEHAYMRFCDQVRLSPAKHHIQEHTLLDGSWVRMVSSYGVDEVVIQPVPPPRIGREFGIGYTVFADVAFAPVYDRPLVDFSSDAPPPYPDPPEFDLPFPVLQSAPRPAFRFRRTIYYSAPATAVPVDFVSELLLGDDVAMSVDGTLETELEVTYGPDGEPVSWFEKAINYNNVPNSVTWSFASGSPAFPTPGNPAQYVGGPQTPYPHSVVPPYPDGTSLGSIGRGVLITSVGAAPHSTSTPTITGPDTPTNRGCAVDTSLREEWYSLDAAADALQAVYNAAFDAAVDAWGVAYQAFVDGPLKAWEDACAAIDAAYPPLGPYTALYAQRAAARGAQVAALHAWLDTGMAPAHLAARLSLFPWNIGTRPVEPPLPALGVVTATGPTSAGENDRYLEFTAAGADRQAEVPDPITDAVPDDVTHFGHDAPHPMGRDFSWGPCLFGWMASGTWRRYAAWRANHAAERPQIAPNDLSTLVFSVRDDYREWLESDLELVDLTNVTIASDGYVPEGTVFKIVQLEYECFDRFSGTWVWTACPQMLALDAVWVKHLGRYSMPPLIDQPPGTNTPRHVRSRQVLRTTRQKDQTWSIPQAVPPDELGPPVALDIPLLMNDAAPFAVVFATGMAVTAVPIVGGSTEFPHEATFLLADDEDAIREASTLEPGQAVDQRHIIAAALRTLKAIPS